MRFASLDLRAASPDASFPSLHTLETRVVSKEGLEYLLEDTKNLESIVLQSLTVLHPEEVADAFGFLINKGFHQSMRRLSFAVFESCDLTPPVLVPLLKFGSLTRLSVTSPCDPIQCKSRLTNGALAQLAKALPQLVELFLGDVLCGSPPPEITLAGLLPFSIHCINLEILQAHFSALNMQWWMRYNYILSLALDFGLAMGALVIFFTVVFPGGGQTGWWMERRPLKPCCHPGSPVCSCLDMDCQVPAILPLRAHMDFVQGSLYPNEFKVICRVNVDIEA